MTYIPTKETIMPDNPDAHRIKTEWLESQLRKNQATDLLLDGISKVQQGGVEGIQEVAFVQPELIIHILQGLVDVVIAQRIDITQVSEDWLKSIEDVEQLRRDYDALVAKYIPQ